MRDSCLPEPAPVVPASTRSPEEPVMRRTLSVAVLVATSCLPAAAPAFADE